MTHPRSPSPSLFGMPVPRRTVLRTAAAVGMVASTPALVACGGDDDGGGGGDGPATGEVTFGSNETGTTFAKQRQAAVADFQTKNAGLTVKLNEIDHNTFQENINNYLQGNPDDVFTWFAGYRMQFFAQRGLIGDISDVWPIDGVERLVQDRVDRRGRQAVLRAAVVLPVGGLLPQERLRRARLHRADDARRAGHSRREDEGATGSSRSRSPTRTAGRRWARSTSSTCAINGYQFHVDLMAGKESWESAEVKKVFDTWEQLLPLHQPDPLGRTWQEAAQALQQKKAGMYLLGTFLDRPVPAERARRRRPVHLPGGRPGDRGGRDRRADRRLLHERPKPKNEAGAKKLLNYLASPDASAQASSIGEPFIASNTSADTAKYTTLQKKSAELVGKAKNIAQFLDRDTRPDFASTVIIPAFQEFIRSPGRRRRPSSRASRARRSRSSSSDRKARHERHDFCIGTGAGAGPGGTATGPACAAQAPHAAPHRR